MFFFHPTEFFGLSDLLMASQGSGISAKKIRQLVQSAYANDYLGQKENMRQPGEQGGKKPGYWLKREFDANAFK